MARVTHPSRRKAAFAAAAVAAAAIGGGTLLTAGQAAAAAGCSATYTVTSQWAGGFVASVGVTNLAASVNGWTVTWSFGSDQRVSSAWNATVAQTGTQVTATNLGYNGTISTGATATFGLQGTFTSGNPVPTSFALNGVACTGAVSTGPSAGASTTLAPSSAAASASASAAPSTVPPAATTPAANGCPETGHVTYTLSRAANPTAAQTDAYNRITAAMDQAVAMYNCYTPITKALNVSYNPSVATADGNINGSIRFGATSTMQRITAMHEIGHTVGVGTYSAWSSKLSGGIWTGTNATNQLRAITGDSTAVVHGDSMHFWPYGLNYTSEVKSDADLIAHCKIVVALRKDMGMN